MLIKCLQKKKTITIFPTHPLMSTCPRDRKQSCQSHVCTHMYNNSTVVYRSQVRKLTLVFLKQGLDNANVVLLQNRIFFSLKWRKHCRFWQCGWTRWYNLTWNNLGTERQDCMVLLICEYKTVEFIKVESEMVICRGCGGSRKGNTRITVQCFILTETHISKTYCIVLIQFRNDVVYIWN
jgi:hypothetical protein